MVLTSIVLGLKIGAGDQCYLYNGKEFSEELGLYDYGARWYDPAVARWTSIDPLADQFSPWSPYNYVYNNPLIHTDPTGMSADNIGVNSNGDIVFDDGKNDGNLFLVNDGSGETATLEDLEINSTQLSSEGVWSGSEEQLEAYVMSQWKHTDNGFSYLAGMMDVSVREGEQVGLGVSGLSVSRKINGVIMMYPSGKITPGLQIDYIKGKSNRGYV